MAKAGRPADDFPVDGDFDERRNWFAARLDGRGREDCILLAGRAALRAMPYLQSLFGLNLPAHKIDGKRHSLAVLRCEALSSLAALAPSEERDAFRSADAARSAAAAADAAFSAAARSATAFARDVDMLDGTPAARRKLVLAPLWPEGISSDIAEVWSRFARELRDAGDEFDIWADWYGGGRRNGKAFPGVLQGTKPRGPSLFGLPRQKALKAWHDIALIPDEFWEEPARVNAEMKRIVAAAREESSDTTSEEEVSATSHDDVRQSAPAKLPAKKGRQTPAVKTKTGAAILENAESIALQAHLLLAVLDDEIVRLKEQRPNSEEAQEERDRKIAMLEELKLKVAALQESTLSFHAGKGSENAALKAAKAFFKPFAEMWSEKGKEFAEIGMRASIFLGATAIAANCGSPPMLAGTVIGAIAAGKPLVEVLKAAKGVFKIWGN